MTIGGCTRLPPAAAIATLMPVRDGWVPQVVVTGGLPVMTLRKAGSGLLNVYVEGDGRAYITRRRPSADPTPVTPTGLLLARAEAGSDRSDANVLYLARPCQFVDVRAYPACRPEVWTTRRFDPNIHNVMQAAYDRIAGRSPAIVIGYSGGALHALALARDRESILAVVTVAGNLDPATTNRWHRVTRQNTALRPLLTPGRLTRLPMLHVVAAGDAVIPPELSEKVVAEAALLRQRVMTVSGPARGIDHVHGWADWWRTAHADLLVMLARCYKHGDPLVVPYTVGVHSGMSGSSAAW